MWRRRSAISLEPARRYRDVACPIFPCTASSSSTIANGRTLAERDTAKTWPTHGLTAGLTCGYDGGCPVSGGRPGRFRSTGRIGRIMVVIREGDPPGKGEDLLRTLLAEE
jgi:hypothetical protein